VPEIELTLLGVDAANCPCEQTSPTSSRRYTSTVDGVYLVPFSNLTLGVCTYIVALPNGQELIYSGSTTCSGAPSVTGAVSLNLAIQINRASGKLVRIQTSTAAGDVFDWTGEVDLGVAVTNQLGCAGTQHVSNGGTATVSLP